MKRIRGILLCIASAMVLFSCSERLGPEAVCSDAGIVIDFSRSGVTKAEMDDMAYERLVHHIDVLIFRNDALCYHEYVPVAASDGSFTLKARKREFDSAQKYKVYLIANSRFDMTYSEGVLNVTGQDKDGMDVSWEVTSLSNLNSIMQEDINLHITGLDLADAPKWFLMDAVATDASGQTLVSLDDGNTESDIVLTAGLVRAASKVFITITEGANVEFSDGSGTPLVTPELFAESQGGLYYIRKMPFRTNLLSETVLYPTTDNLFTTTKTNNAYFTWLPSDFITDPASDRDCVTLTTYVYAHKWENDGIFESEPCVVVNLPLIYVTDLGDGTYDAHAHPNSWYKIPMTLKGKEFGRNKYYQVNVTVNRAGAVTMTDPIEVDNVYYKVSDWDNETGGWISQTVEVSQSDRPKYLTVNESVVDMFNKSSDETTLEFSSSSSVSVSVASVYYFDKFGQQQTVYDSESDNADACDVTVKWDNSTLFGNIAVYSPVPQNNTVRYIVLKVDNEDGSPTQYVTVRQYSLEYITNVQGYYSYRDDFYYPDGSGNNLDNASVPTNYEYMGDKIVSATWNNNSKTWTYSTSRGGFFSSKVATLSTQSAYAGKSKLDYYYWGSSGGGFPGGPGGPGGSGGSSSNTRLTSSYKTASEGGNARMYHVRITASSKDYTVGIPKLDASGYTDSGTDNARLVSPSFMIASQLGATLSPNSAEQAASHCSHYVETYRDADGNVQEYTNWRLPTRAEVEIIMKFQYADNAAMDEVLAGENYWCADGGLVHNYTIDPYNEVTSSYVRCIRDDY